MIKTTKKMRDLYAKHLNKLSDYADGNFDDEECYMCTADDEKDSDCKNCPLFDGGDPDCDSDKRRINLIRGDFDISTNEYKKATPESILNHARWIERRIVDRTDCEFYWRREK